MRALISGIFVLFAFASVAQIKTPSPSARWVTLFDGRAVGEWRGFRSSAFPGEVWAVKDRALYRRKTDSDYRRDLVSRRESGDFELEFEWRIAPGGNSGVKYLVREDRPASWEKSAYIRRRNEMFRQGLTDTEEFRKLSAARYRTSPIGFEFQILDDRSHPDSANGPHRKTGALYDLLPRNREPEAPAGAFNRGRILVQGPRVEHWVNGVKVLEYDRRGPRLRNSIAASKFADMPGFGQNARGRITLQDHGDEVWFRRIRIRELR